VEGGRVPGPGRMGHPRYTQTRPRPGEERGPTRVARTQKGRIEHVVPQPRSHRRQSFPCPSSAAPTVVPVLCWAQGAMDPSHAPSEYKLREGRAVVLREEEQKRR
jgi:hypothetical protein